MSLLPQRKKSPEEIARLRESLGVPSGAAHEESPAPPPAETLVPHTHAADLVRDAAPAPLAPLPAPKAVHSLKKSEQTPPPKPAPAPAPPASVIEPKPVRSLRKSEMTPSRPLTPSEPDGDGRIPFRRHSEREIEEIRRREALAMLNAPPPNPKLFPAHPALIAPGYGFATGGAACFAFESFPIAATAGCIVAALLVAIAILCFRPVSRHHSAFIFIIALFVLVFAVLHYFPHLRHAT
jgi:hypothetical protein